jgi:uncharacterized protein (DUF885 family)
VRNPVRIGEIATSVESGKMFDTWADDFAATWVRANPQLATRTQYFEGALQDEVDRELALTHAFGSTFGERAAQEQAALARRGLDGLRTYAPDDLSTVQRTSAAIVEWNLKNAVANAAFARQRFVFSQMVGLHVGIVSFLTANHPVRNVRDAENYVARLTRVAGCLDAGIAEAVAAAAAGVIPPDFIIERTIAQIDGLTGPAPADNVLVATLVERMREAGVTNVAPARALSLAAEAADVVRDDILPALGRVRAMLADQRPHATAAAGAWALPDGEAFYARELASSTGSSLTADEIHAIGLREVARIESEMDEILGRLGVVGGPLNERIARLNEKVAPVAGPDPRAAILAQIQAVMDDAALRARETFNLVPVAPAVVRREPAFSEKTAAAHYQTPAADGTHPGIYWIPLPTVDPQQPWLGIGLKSTAYHEAIPGHHFQLTIEQESRTLPRFRKRGAFGYDAAYNEGWALYSERLCAESNWYGDDLVGYLGFLHMQLFRARRLVADTGLHAKRWTREQAIAYGLPASEVERYVSWPGQACAYMIGQLRIVEFRERAKARLGKRFAIKDFHDLVLGAGTMPLDVLEAVIDGWDGG